MSTAIETPEEVEQPKQRLWWEKDRTSYVCEVRVPYSDFRKVRNLSAAVWWIGDKGNLCLGRATNFRSAELADGRCCVVVCDVTFGKQAKDKPTDPEPPDHWKDGWKAKGVIRAWAETGYPYLRVMDYDILGPVEVVEGVANG